MKRSYRVGYLILIFTIILGMYFMYVGIRYPNLNLHVEPNLAGDWVVTQEPGEDSWAQGHVHAGDIIREVDSRSPDDNIRLVKHHNLGMAERSLVLEREGESFKLLIPAFQTGDTFYTQILVSILVFGMLILLSWRAYRTQRGQLDTHLLIAFSLAVGVSYVCATASSRGELIGAVMVRALLVSVPAFFLHFLYVFFAKRQTEPFIPFPFIRLGYAAVTFWLLMPLCYYGTDVSVLIPYSLYQAMVLLTFVLLQAVIVVAMIRNYIRSSGRERILHMYVMLGQLGAFAPFIFLYALPYSLLGAYIISGETAALFLLLVPFLCFYLLKVKEAFDINFLLYRLRYYGWMALWPSLIIAAILLLIWQETGYTAIKWLQSFLLIYAGMIVFLYVKDFMPTRLRNTLFKDPFIQRSRPEQLMSKLSRLMNLQELERALVKEIESVLKVRSIVILECVEETYRIRYHQGSLPTKEILQEIAGSARVHAQQGSFLPVSAGTCLLYGAQQGRCQALWFGSKYDQTRLNPDERTWLQNLVNYASLLYVNLQLTEDFIGQFEQNLASQKHTPTWLLRLLFSISENERKRLSSDLHDSALQDQLLLYRRLESVLVAASDLRQPVLDELLQVRDGLLDVIGQIRETCNELRPPFLKEMGIVEAIQHLLGHVRLRTNLSIELDTASFEADLNEHQVLTLYRIVQELLQNAGKHAKGATTIKLKLASTAEGVWLFYRDDGGGMDASKLKSSFTHMGLWGIQERVASLEGTMQLQSEPGQGLRLQLQIPHTYTNVMYS